MENNLSASYSRSDIYGASFYGSLSVFFSVRFPKECNVSPFFSSSHPTERKKNIHKKSFVNAWINFYRKSIQAIQAIGSLECQHNFHLSVFTVSKNIQTSWTLNFHKAHNVLRLNVLIFFLMSRNFANYHQDESLKMKSIKWDIMADIIMILIMINAVSKAI